MLGEKLNQGGKIYVEWWDHSELLLGWAVGRKGVRGLSADFCFLLVSSFLAVGARSCSYTFPAMKNRALKLSAGAKSSFLTCFHQVLYSNNLESNQSPVPSCVNNQSVPPV